ncbi:MAG: fructosamine kinase family protein [Bacteroidota bacterium]|nr:fructosamine kinase family protein [Bacteroidota bacterium]
MDASILQKTIEEEFGLRVLQLSPLHGGSIASSYQAKLSEGRNVFVKANPQSDDMFVKEAHGLEELQKANVIRTPGILHVSNSILILELLPVSSYSNRKIFFEEFGRAFASLHRYTSLSFGFYENNYIGSTPQKNLPQSQSWTEFYLNKRMQFQFHLAEKNGYSNSELSSLFNKLEKRIDDLIPVDGEPPALLHGDLWSGNYLCLENNTPAIIDPAVYYGHREADLAMTFLFGGFESSFYDAYNEAYPLNNGWQKRIEIYKLYHLFNHLNLFGEGYYGQVVETLKRLTK